MKFTVVTATCGRPHQLAGVLRMVHAQTRKDFDVDHVVVADGHDEKTMWLAERFGSRYVPLEPRIGVWGAGGRDLGIAVARGDWVVFWDDDNVYDHDALLRLREAIEVMDKDILIARVLYVDIPNQRHMAIPTDLTKPPTFGDVDTMCLCVRTEVAKTCRWLQDDRGRGNDYRWLTRMIEAGWTYGYVNTVIGAKPETKE